MYWTIILAALKKFGGFVLKNWKAFLVLAVLLAVAWKYHSLTSEIGDLTTKNTALTTQVTNLKADNKQLADTLDTTKKSAVLYKSTADKLDKQFNDLNQLLTTDRNTFNKRLAGLKGQTAPTTDKASIDYLLHGAADLRSKKK